MPEIQEQIQDYRSAPTPFVADLLFSSSPLPFGQDFPSFPLLLLISCPIVPLPLAQWTNQSDS